MNKPQVPPIKDFEGLRRAWSQTEPGAAGPGQAASMQAGSGGESPMSKAAASTSPSAGDRLEANAPARLGLPSGGKVPASALLEYDEALRRKDAEVSQLTDALALQASEIQTLRQRLKQHDEGAAIERAALEKDRSAFEAELEQLDRVAERERQVRLREELLASNERELIARERALGELGQIRELLRKRTQELAAKDLQISVAADSVKSLDAKCVRLERAQTDLVRALSEVRHQHERALIAGRDARAEAGRRQAEVSELRGRLNALEMQAARDSRALRALRAVNERLEEAAASSPQLWTSDRHLLGWLLQHASRRAIGLRGRSLGWSGAGPFPDDVLDPALRKVGFELLELAHESIGHVVVGRSDWSEEALLDQIDLRQGKTLRVYSQEMLALALITGLDPLDSQDDKLLEAFKRGHPALEFLAGEAFRWPSIAVPDSSRFVPLTAADLGVTESPLHVLGYKVGATSSLETRGRRDLLRRAFELSELPFVESESYMSRWGTRRSHQRLWRIATHIAHLVNGPVGRDYRKPQARRDWIDDLRWLKREFYEPRRFKFAWPDVEVAVD